MIKINLLGDSTIVDNSKYYVLGAYIASLVLFIGLFAWLYLSTGYEIADLEVKEVELSDNLQRLMKQTREVKNLEKKKVEATSKLVQVAKLKKSKLGPVRVMDDLNMALPEKVWIRQVLEKANSMSIKGRALTNKDLAVFWKNVEASDYFSNVTLQESRQMFYSKKTGKVIAQVNLSSLRSQSRDFSSESRRTKSSTSRPGIKTDKRMNPTAGTNIIYGDVSRSIRKKGKTKTGYDHRKAVDENYVRIIEFRLSADIKYYGKLETHQAETDSEESKTKKGS